MSTVVLESHIDCASEVAALWKALSNTDYVNRSTGMSAVTHSKLQGTDAARYLVAMRAGGFLVEWEELPFEWVHEQSFSVRRRMRKGPISWVDTHFGFEALDSGGTRVTVHLELLPKLSLLSTMVRFMGGRSLSAIIRTVERVDLAIGAGRPLPAPAGRINEDGLLRVSTALKRQAPPALVDKLVTLIRTERDDVVARIRPHEWADAWGVDRRALLTTCLLAVKSGLLELRWEVICPSCRTAAERLPTLRALDSHGECHLCDLSFGLELDESVEATFLPSAAVRRVDQGRYCMGGPARTPHVLAQAVLAPYASVSFVAPAEPGRCRLFARGGQVYAVEIAADGPPTAEAKFGADAAAGKADVTGPRLRVAPGGTITVHSTAALPRHVKLERTQFPALAATAREVTALPGFRRDFSAEVLRADVSLQVSRVALLFSDLTDSTQLYSNVGDAAALKLVQDHFELVVKQIEAHGGTLVKTIGDAVMAAFVDELDAMHAALAILQAWGPFREGSPVRAHTHIKLGLYAGPSYLVTANGVLDYFGQTVNIAARLQSEARRDEVVVEASLYERALAASGLPATSVTEAYRASLKGVDRVIDVVRIRLA